MKAILKTPQKRTAQMKKVIIKQYPELENLEVTPSAEEQVFKSSKYGFDEVKVKGVEGEEVTITPSLEEQTKEGLFKKVTVNAIESEEITIVPSANEQVKEGLFDKVTVEPIPNSEVISKDVDFIDYDGTLLYSYTLEEIQAMTELPPLPTQEGLICQEWNWSLEDIKAFGRRLIVGATYITDDGKTRIYIELITEDRLEMSLGIQQTVSNGIEIDWGDGTPVETFSGTSYSVQKHLYECVGNYIITLNPIDDCLLRLGSGNTSSGITGTNSNPGRVKYHYANAITKVNFGRNIGDVSYMFYECRQLAKVTLSNYISKIGYGLFSGCTSLETVVIPNGITNIEGNSFGSNSGIQKILIPNGIVDIINQLFNTRYSLHEIIIPDSVTSIGSTAFYNCYSLHEIIIPDSVTSIGESMCNGCHSMRKLKLSNNITSISDSSFSNCYSLSKIKMPSNVINIKYQAFNNCYSMKKYDFSEHNQVPTLENTNAFGGIPKDCQIIVPDELYDEWIAATNWSNYANYIVKASEVA